MPQAILFSVPCNILHWTDYNWIVPVRAIKFRLNKTCSIVSKVKGKLLNLF